MKGFSKKTIGIGLLVIAAFAGIQYFFGILPTKAEVLSLERLSALNGTVLSAGNSNSGEASFSRDGSYVVFISHANDLVEDDTNGQSDVFVLDRSSGEIERVSISSDGEQANFSSNRPVISENGRYVAFESASDNLVADDTNGSTDVFLHDRQTGVTERISIADNEDEGTDGGGYAYMSADARYITFASSSANLVVGDTNGQYDVFVRDRQAGTTERVSITDDDEEAVAYSGGLSNAITDDGRYVFFPSDGELAAGDTNAAYDIFRRDRVAGTTERVSLSDADGEISDGAFNFSTSADGRYVSFETSSSDVVAGDTNGSYDTYLRDMQLGTTVRVSLADDESEPDEDANYSSVSLNGRYVAFESTADNLVAGDTNGKKDIFLRDVVSGTTERISVSTDGDESVEDSTWVEISSDGTEALFQTSGALIDEDADGEENIYIRDLSANTTEWLIAFDAINQPNGTSDTPSISDDNNVVVFESSASNLVAGDNNNNEDIFVLYRDTGAIELVSVADGGGFPNGSSFAPKISGNGRYVTFTSESDDIVPGDTNDEDDVFVRDLQLGITERISVAQGGGNTNASSDYSSISSDGRYVVFESEATNIIVDDENDVRDIFRYDRQTDTVVRVSVSSDEEEADDHSERAVISGDGNRVVFESDAINLVADDTNLFKDIFLRDIQAGTTIRVSQTVANGHGDGATYDGRFSENGEFVVFVSEADDLVVDDINEVEDIFILERSSGDIERVSVGDGEEEADDSSFSPVVSSDGRYVVFGSNATNLVTGDTNTAADVFIRDRQLQTTQRVSVSDTEEELESGSDDNASISDNGRYVVFASGEDDVVAGDTNGYGDIFVRDVISGTTTRVSVGDGEEEGDGTSFRPEISGDGSSIVFLSYATNFVAGDTGGYLDLFVRNIQNGTTQRVNVSSDEGESNDNATEIPAISYDGRYVVFMSGADNLVADDTNSATDVFIRDIQGGTTERVSVATDGSEGDDSTEGRMAISSDGRYVAFISEATNLVTGDNNGESDGFIRDRQLNTTERISVANDEREGNGDTSNGIDVTSDGRYVLFGSNASNLSTFDFNETADVFIRDRNAQTTTFAVLLEENVVEGNNTSRHSTISSDGNYIAFDTAANNLISFDTNNERDVLLYNVQEASLERIMGLDGEETNDVSTFPSLSSNGRFVAFYSYADNLIEDDENDTSDVFLYDRESGETILVSVAMDGTQVTNDDADEEYGFDVSADGEYVVFSSYSNLLVTGDTNNEADIFLASLTEQEDGGGGDDDNDNDRGSRSGSVVRKSPTTDEPVKDDNTPTVCIPQHFDSYLRKGSVGLQVVRMQQFLRERGFYTGPVTGYFGARTEEGVKKFQKQYTVEVLSPWVLTEPTGIWGRTTRAMANKFDGCNEGKVILPNGVELTF